MLYKFSFKHLGALDLRNRPFYLNGRKCDIVSINTVLTRNPFLWYIILNVQGSNILCIQPMVGSLEVIVDEIRFNFSKSSDDLKIKDSKLFLLKEAFYLLENTYRLYKIKNIFYKKYMETNQELDINIQSTYDTLLFGIRKFILEYVLSFKRIFHIQNIMPPTILDRLTIKTIYENGLNLELIFPITYNICYPSLITIKKLQ
jgi:hypothetical protein